jgi:hypothetical protein
MSFPCSENTVVVNTTHKMLSQLQQANPNLVATMPTRRMENILGYDVEFESWKLFFLQYKRPVYRNRRFYYNLDISQNIKLLFWPIISGASCAFFPLVLVRSDQHLAQLNPQLLDNVIFVDAMNVWPVSTMIRVEVRSHSNLNVHYKIRDGPWMPIRGFIFWKDIKSAVESCEIGGMMKHRGETTEANRLLREAIYSLSRNQLPSWWRSRVKETIGDSFVERRTLQILEFTDELLSENRRREKPTNITSRSFRAFIYPVAS